jgi:predicted metal-binding protein
MNAIKPPCTHRHLLICTNSRPPGAPKPSCGHHGAAALREDLKKAVREAGYKGALKVTATGCLDVCPAAGVAVSFYPDDSHFIVEAQADREALWQMLTAGQPRPDAS